ncbi:hypothetical protein V5799_018722 [Amblyomma americanum]|uniref:Uncharacterized protein n=1 Tax=Amblyomma americanum TaxID=6943 RepID=A0AAQ4EZK4_AMBAM
MEKKHYSCRHHFFKQAVIKTRQFCKYVFDSDSGLNSACFKNTSALQSAAAVTSASGGLPVLPSRLSNDVMHLRSNLETTAWHFFHLAAPHGPSKSRT